MDLEGHAQEDGQEDAGAQQEVAPIHRHPPHLEVGFNSLRAGWGGGS